MLEFEIVNIAAAIGVQAPPRVHTDVQWLLTTAHHRPVSSADVARQLQTRYAAYHARDEDDAIVPLILCACDEGHSMLPHVRLERSVRGLLAPLAE